jgi:dienelactone hydrolase
VTVPGALFQSVIQSQENIDRDLDLALRRLQQMPEVDSQRIAVAGFCFGGTQAMHLGIRNGEVALTAIFYGSNPVTDAGVLGSLGARGPVLAIYGEKDRLVSPQNVAAFEQALRTRGVEALFHRFPGQGHAFVDSGSIRVPGPAADAWELLRQFLRTYL